MLRHAAANEICDVLIDEILKSSISFHVQRACSVKARVICYNSIHCSLIS